ncbi:MAG: hypothetical protein ABI969_20365, partial [bacterium]
MVDRLASELLALRAGEGERLSTLSGVPLPALRAYLDGTALYRRAKFAAATKQFDRAIQFDSTFALAGLGLATSAEWAGYPSDHTRGLTVAWRFRSRLGARDQALLLATAGPNFPGLSGWKAMISAKERYAALAPDRADAQFELGDYLFHFGAAAGIPDAHMRAADGFNRAIALDSSFSPAMEHLVVVEMERRDSAKVVQLARLYLSTDSSSENRDGMRWALAVTMGDAATARAILARKDSFSMVAIATISEVPVVVGRAIESTQSLADATPAAGDRKAEYFAFVLRHDLAFNRGRPKRGLTLLDSMRSTQPVPGLDDFERVRDVLFWDADTTGADESARALRRRAALGGPVPGSGKRGKDPVYFGDLCTAELWSLSHGDTTGARGVAGIMLAGLDMRDSLSSPQFRVGCARMLDAQLAVMQGRADARALVDSLDNFLRTAPEGPIMSMGNLAAARLYERLGDTRAALFAVRRRVFFYGRTLFYSTYLRDEARLAEKAGDTVGAADALRKYIAMRTEPERSFVADTREARAAL